MKTQPMNDSEQTVRAKKIKASVADANAMRPVVRELYDANANGYADEMGSLLGVGFTREEAMQLICARLGSK